MDPRLGGQHLYALQEGPVHASQQEASLQEVRPGGVQHVFGAPLPAAGPVLQTAASVQLLLRRTLQVHQQSGPAGERIQDDRFLGRGGLGRRRGERKLSGFQVIQLLWQDILGHRNGDPLIVIRQGHQQHQLPQDYIIWKCKSMSKQHGNF